MYKFSLLAGLSLLGQYVEAQNPAGSKQSASSETKPPGYPLSESCFSKEKITAAQ
jgi:hypothetical protein